MKAEVCMMNIRPVTDLRNKFSEIEQMVSEGEPVYLTKNGYGTMVVLSIDEYSNMISMIDAKLAESEMIANATSKRYSHDEVFGRIREFIDNGR